MILNRQHAVRVNLSRLRSFERELGRALKLGRREFNIGLVDDHAITRLNAAYRRKKGATDVLSFPWRPASARSRDGGPPAAREFAQFLGDVVISAETARRNARREGDSAEREIRRLILHGVLHLLGYDHETDRGEMTARELAMRERLLISD